jgi:hypothetical protein
MRRSVADYFNRDRISWTRRVPEIIGTRIGYLDLLPGSLIRFWIVLEQEKDAAGNWGPCDLRGHLIMPVETTLRGRPLVGAWMESQGLHVPTLEAAEAERPSGMRLM